MPFDGAFSPLHWLIVGVVALLVLGPDQLPKMARQEGHWYKEFARVRAHLTTELRDMVSEFDLNGVAGHAGTPPAATADDDAVSSGGQAEEST